MRRLLLLSMPFLATTQVFAAAVTPPTHTLTINRETKFDMPFIVFEGNCGSLDLKKVKDAFTKAELKDQTQETTLENYIDALKAHSLLLEDTSKLSAGCTLHSYGCLGRFRVKATDEKSEIVVKDSRYTEIPIQGKGAFVAFKRSTPWNTDIRTGNLAVFNTAPVLVSFDTTKEDQYVSMRTLKGSLLGDDKGLQPSFQTAAAMTTFLAEEAKREEAKGEADTKIAYAPVGRRVGKIAAEGVYDTLAAVPYVLGMTASAAFRSRKAASRLHKGVYDGVRVIRDAGQTASIKSGPLSTRNLGHRLGFGSAEPESGPAKDPS